MEEEVQIKPRANRRKEVTLLEKKLKKLKTKNNSQNEWNQKRECFFFYLFVFVLFSFFFFFEKINKIDKSLGRLAKDQREETQVASIRFESITTTDPMDINRIIRQYYEQLSARFGDFNGLDNSLKETNYQNSLKIK